MTTSTDWRMIAGLSFISNNSETEHKKDGLMKRFIFFLVWKSMPYVVHLFLDYGIMIYTNFGR